MSTKLTSKIALVLICAMISITICSCTGGVNPVQEVQNITSFATNIYDATTSISSTEITEEEKIAKIESLFRPESGITLETLQEELSTNEKLQEITSVNQVEIIDMPSIEDLSSLLQYNEELGGCVYTAAVQVSIDGVIVTIDITLLSDETGMGIYDYNIK